MNLRFRSLFLITFACCLVPGCGSKEINPLEDERGIYSFYGALDMDRDTNYIRVRDLRIPLLYEQTIGERTVVDFEDVEQGTLTVLQDLIVQINGHTIHNFVLNQKLRPRQPYRITARRNDGALSESIATTPGITITSAVPDENVRCRQLITFQFDNVLPTEQVRAEAGFEYEGEMYWFEITRFCEFRRDEQQNSITLEVSPINLLGLIFPPRNVNILTCPGTPSTVNCNELSSNVARLRFFHLGPEWQRVFPHIQVNPENVMDVENGLGFFGAFRSDTITYTLSID